MKRTLVTVLLLAMACTLFASDLFSVSSDELKLYDAQGKEMPLTDQVAGMVGNGWIITSGDKKIIITTPVGTVILESDTTLVTGTLVTDTPSLYLVDGSASFRTEEDFAGTLTVSTPVTQFQAKGPAGFLIASTKTEESVSVWQGDIRVVNGITGRMQKVSASTTYDVATNTTSPFTPTEDQYRSVAVDNLQPVITPVTPSAPTSTTTAMTPEEPKTLQANTTPSAPTSLTATVKPETENTLRIAPEPQSLTVTSVPVEVVPPPVASLSVTSVAPQNPSAPTTLQVKETVSQKPEPAEETPQSQNVYHTTFVITVTPMTPGKPVFKPTKIRVMAPQTAIEEPQAKVTTEPKEAETVTEPATAAAPVSSLTTSVSKRPSVIGVALSYQFTMDTTQRMEHAVFAKPFFNSEYLSLKLNAYARTSDFTSYQSNVTVFAHDSMLQTIASVLDYIDGLSIGKQTAPFYFAIDHTNNYAEEGSLLASGNTIETGEKNAFLALRFSSVTFRMLFRDLSFQPMLDGNTQFQYGNVSFTYAPDAKSISMALGAQYRLNNASTIETYPYFNVNLPVVSTRLFAMNALFGIASYLPVSPAVDITGIYDSSSSDSFPNYLVSGGLSLGGGGFTFQMFAETHKGVVMPLMDSEFSRASVDTSFTSTLDVVGKADWQGKYFSASLMYLQPLVITGSTVSRGMLNAATSLGADYLEASFRLSLGSFSLKAGYAIYGIGQLTGMEYLESNYATASVTTSYTISNVTFSLGARKMPGTNPLQGFVLCTYTLGKEL